MPSPTMNTINTRLLMYFAFGYTQSVSKSVKKQPFPPRMHPKRIFKQYKRHRGNPGRANRHKFTNKDMRFW